MIQMRERERDGNAEGRMISDHILHDQVAIELEGGDLERRMGSSELEMQMRYIIVLATTVQRVGSARPSGYCFFLIPCRCNALACHRHQIIVGAKGERKFVLFFKKRALVNSVLDVRSLSPGPTAREHEESKEPLLSFPGKDTPS